MMRYATSVLVILQLIAFLGHPQTKKVLHATACFCAQMGAALIREVNKPAGPETRPAVTAAPEAGVESSTLLPGEPLGKEFGAMAQPEDDSRREAGITEEDKPEVVRALGIYAKNEEAHAEEE